MATPTLTEHHIPLGASAVAVGSGIVWSFGAIAARLATHTDAFQYLVWRSVAIIVVMELIGAIRRQPSLLVRAFRSGRRMLVANVGLLVASIGFVYAVKTTTLANAAFLSSLTPLATVVLARIVLHERLTSATVAAIGAALVGLTIMVGGDLHGGNMIGNLAAMASSVGFAVYAVAVRSAPTRDWSPVMPGYAAIMIAICTAVTLFHGKTLVPPAHDIGLATFHGAVFITGGTLMFNWASRHVAAAAMTVFAQAEMVFVPLWAFLEFSERPKTTTLIGGCIILAAIVAKALIDARAIGSPDATITDYGTQPGQAT